ncbi:MAG: hypothetical protein AB8B63_14490 [Granulosicoccus sp.]
MNQIRKPAALLVALGLGLAPGVPVQANVWVFEPSVSIDQRFDDNYYLLPDGGAELSATRAVGDLGLSRESATSSVNGSVRVDSLLTNDSDVGEGELDVNGLLSLDTVFRTQRSRFSFGVSYKVDTPSRDIAADISEEVSVASDTGVSVTQALTSNVGRSEIVIKPGYQFDVTRRLTFDSILSFSQVKHELPAAQDVIYEFYLDQYGRNADVPTNPDGSPLAYSDVDINTVSRFATSGELSDFTESEIEIGLRYKLSPISTAVFTGGFGRFVSEVEVPVKEESGLREPDDEVVDLFRSPRRDSVSNKSTFKLGYERFLRPNLQLAITGGVYTNTTDNSDIVALENQWGTDGPTPEETETDGWLADVGLTFDSGTTRYSGRFSLDVQPSSSGTQVETQELIGELFRVLSPRTRFAFRARAYEPDRLAANPENRFARRFISFEPKLEWKFSRNWTLTSAYRYRRQKVRTDSTSAQSNAVLFAVKYTPPSEIRDAARANGL